MADTLGFLTDFLGQLEAFGVSASRARPRAANGDDCVMFGGSSLEVLARPWPDGAAADATDGARWPFAFGKAYPSGDGGRVRHRGVRRGHVHADLYEWMSSEGGKRTLDLHATVGRRGAWYGLRASSNSADFAADRKRKRVTPKTAASRPCPAWFAQWRFGRPAPNTEPQWACGARS